MISMLSLPSGMVLMAAPPALGSFTPAAAPGHFTPAPGLFAPAPAPGRFFVAPGHVATPNPPPYFTPPSVVGAPVAAPLVPSGYQMSINQLQMVGT